MKIRKNDEVIVIAGSHKGKSGKVLEVFPKTQQVKIQDVNKVIKHVKPSQQKQEGGIETFEAPIHVSNVALLVKKASKDKTATFSKIGFQIKDGKKIRIAKKTGKAI